MISSRGTMRMFSQQNSRQAQSAESNARNEYLPIKQTPFMVDELQTLHKSQSK